MAKSDRDGRRGGDHLRRRRARLRRRRSRLRAAERRRFALARSQISPETAFFDGERPIGLRYSFRARRRLDLVIRVVDRGEGEQTVRRWIERDLSPARIHRRRWDGRLQNGDPAPDGAYAFRVGPVGHAGTVAGGLELHDHLFPVAGAHAYGDPFGEPRSGGRVHEGRDLPAAAGHRWWRRAAVESRRAGTATPSTAIGS